jgi:hypothetical protein
MLLSSRIAPAAPQASSRGGSRAPVACRAAAAQRYHQQEQQQQQQQQQHHHHHQPLASLAAAAALACCLAAAPPAFADAPKSSEPGQNVGFLTNKDLDTRRQQAGFRRSYDGRVAITNKATKEWLDVKCDLQVRLPGWPAGWRRRWWRWRVGWRRGCTRSRAPSRPAAAGAAGARHRGAAGRG